MLCRLCLQSSEGRALLHLEVTSTTLSSALLPSPNDAPNRLMTKDNYPVPGRRGFVLATGPSPTSLKQPGTSASAPLPGHFSPHHQTPLHSLQVPRILFVPVCQAYQHYPITTSGVLVLIAPVQRSRQYALSFCITRCSAALTGGRYWAGLTGLSELDLVDC